VSGAREAFLEAGMNDFISKPIDAGQLNLMLLKWLPPDKLSSTLGNKQDPGEGISAQTDEFWGLLQELGQVEGLDIQAGLSHVGHDKATYIMILRQFCKEFDGYLEEIQGFTAKENWKEYSIRLHAMKGVFANIGMDSLSKWAYKLEQASKNNEYSLCIEETEPICQQMYWFRETLIKTGLMELGEAAKKTLVTQGVLEEKLKALVQACKIGAGDAADTLAAELDKMTYNEAADEMLREISNLAASLDYDIIPEKVVQLRRLLA
jgi:HPt (histidine-containing phosphotransfer) domain-containing protein